MRLIMNMAECSCLLQEQAQRFLEKQTLSILKCITDLQLSTCNEEARDKSKSEICFGFNNNN